MSQVSIKDIALLAEVSHPTVSRALRKSPLVNPETAEKIRAIAQQMGYRPSAVARSLVNKKTKTIGVVVTTIADPFNGEVVSGVEEAANEHGYSIFLANSNADPEREMKVVHSFHERRVDGIIVTSSRVGALYMPLLGELNIPTVLINNQHPSEFVYSVMIDNISASRDAVKHLIQLGHRRIAYLGDQFGFESDAERLLGYRQALVDARIRFLPELAIQGDGKAEGGMEAMLRLLSLPKPPTAVFCYNDMSAIGAIRAAHDRALSVPEDISIVGFDDLSIASFTRPLLTTIRQPKWRMGRLAIETLLQLLSGAPAQNSVKLAGELVVRKSTAPPKSGE